MPLRTYPVSKSRFGYFSPDATEYVITECDLMRPWLNFLANGKYQIWLSQTLGGMSLFNQDLRINNYYGKFDVPGKYVFVRDDDTGEYWSANWVPFFRQLQHFRCTHGMNYSTLETQTGGIRTTIRVLLPPGEACEVWTVTVENRSGRARRLSLYPYVQWRLACFIRADNEHEWFSECDFHRRENCIVATYRYSSTHFSRTGNRASPTITITHENTPIQKNLSGRYASLLPSSVMPQPLRNR